MVTALNGAEQRRNTNESHMCLVLAWRQVVQRPTAFFRSRGQHPLTELLSCRHASEDSLSDRKRIQSPNLSFLRTGFHKTYVHCEALHASMQPMTASKANSNFKSSSAPVWIDCDSGSDDALGIACLLASPEEHVDKPILASRQQSLCRHTFGCSGKCRGDIICTRKHGTKRHNVHC